MAHTKVRLTEAMDVACTEAHVEAGAQHAWRDLAPCCVRQLRLNARVFWSFFGWKLG
ncbi:hypothetical protein V6Z11_D09G074800 [Gossypium hirsutum]